jgi:tRNA dimethylallyltransferase
MEAIKYSGVEVQVENVIVIAGPTASGKTKISIELAQRINGEIISADSMQIYRYMDIGTAKPDKAEMKGIKHYLIDEVTPDVEFSVARFQSLALKYVREIADKGKIPIIAGGTGLYINSLIYNLQFSETISDWKLREELKREAETKGNKYLHDELRKIDPESAARIHENDIKRIIRAIEVYRYTNKPISYHKEISRSVPPEYNYIVIGLKTDREELYDRIDKRVDLMIEKGLVDEVRQLVEMGYDKNSIAMQGLGYKEILWYLKGILTFDEAVYLIKKDTRHYAKRQITWLKRINEIKWVSIDECGDISGILKKIGNYIAITGIIL